MKWSNVLKFRNLEPLKTLWWKDTLSLYLGGPEMFVCPRGVTRSHPPLRSGRPVGARTTNLSFLMQVFYTTDFSGPKILVFEMFSAVTGTCSIELANFIRLKLYPWFHVCYRFEVYFINYQNTTRHLLNEGLYFNYWFCLCTSIYSAMATGWYCNKIVIDLKLFIARPLGKYFCWNSNLNLNYHYYRVSTNHVYFFTNNKRCCLVYHTLQLHANSGSNGWSKASILGSNSFVNISYTEVSGLDYRQALCASWLPAANWRASLPPFVSQACPCRPAHAALPLQMKPFCSWTLNPRKLLLAGLIEAALCGIRGLFGVQLRMSNAWTWLAAADGWQIKHAYSTKPGFSPLIAVADQLFLLCNICCVDFS